VGGRRQRRGGAGVPLSSPSTLRSSSTSGQWMPSPLPRSSQLFLCSAVASRSRGNHARGTQSTRPSARLTTSSSSVQETSWARGLTLTAEVLIPSLQELNLMLENEDANLAKLLRRKVGGPRERDGLQPVLRELVAPPNVDVWGLDPFVTEEEEPVWPRNENGRHNFLRTRSIATRLRARPSSPHFSDGGPEMGEARSPGPRSVVCPKARPRSGSAPMTRGWAN